MDGLSRNAPFHGYQLGWFALSLSDCATTVTNLAKDAERIDLSTPLSIRSAFMFPLQSSLARKEILWGALLLCIPVVGWLLNMGHRIAMTRRMQQGLPAWPAWR